MMTGGTLISGNPHMDFSQSGTHKENVQRNWNWNHRGLLIGVQSPSSIERSIDCFFGHFNNLKIQYSHSLWGLWGLCPNLLGVIWHIFVYVFTFVCIYIYIIIYRHIHMCYVFIYVLYRSIY